MIQFVSIISNTNVGTRGIWMFQIGDVGDGTIREPDLVDGVGKSTSVL